MFKEYKCLEKSPPEPHAKGLCTYGEERLSEVIFLSVQAEVLFVYLSSGNNPGNLRRCQGKHEASGL